MESSPNAGQKGMMEQAFDWLKTGADSPWQKLKWNMRLEE